jgi:hypothetical protein
MENIESSPKYAKRGKETLFRVAYQHQSKLIQIADYKANIIISISTTIISAIIAITGYGAISDKIGEFGLKLVIPGVMIILTCLVSLIFAIQAARPKLLQIKRRDDPQHKSSLLFFGVIASHNQPSYLEKMKSLINSGEQMYEHMTIDLHNQGLILQRKYTLLVYSYQVLMFGFIISVLLFLGMLLVGY